MEWVAPHRACLRRLCASFGSRPLASRGLRAPGPFSTFLALGLSTPGVFGPPVPFNWLHRHTACKSSSPPLHPPPSSASSPPGRSSCAPSAAPRAAAVSAAASPPHLSIPAKRLQEGENLSTPAKLLGPPGRGAWTSSGPSPAAASSLISMSTEYAILPPKFWGTFLRRMLGRHGGHA